MRLRRRRVDVDGRTYVIDRAVFDPAAHLSGVALARHLPGLLHPSASVLDLGTGCGILAGVAAPHVQNVVATDISAAAVANARDNLAGLDVDVRKGDLFEPVTGERFDIVITNPPYEIDDAGDLRYGSPDFLERFGAQVRGHADSIILGYPADDADILAICDLPLVLTVKAPTTGLDLGIFTADLT